MFPPLPEEALPLCGIKLGVMECVLEADHGGMHLAMADTPEGMAEVQWLDGCPRYVENAWMSGLTLDNDEGMPPVMAFSVPEDGRLHLDWFSN